MKSRLNTKSLFGYVPYIFSKKVARWHTSSLKQKKEFLHIDDKDGHLALYTLSSGLNATVYEPNENFLYGGKEDVPVNIPNTDDYIFINQMIKGLEDRAKLNFVESGLNMINRNFYEINDLNKYIYVTACRSLDRKSNRHIPMDIKINKLKNSVAEEGYLYIEYLIATKEEDFDNYPASSYLRKDEILQYINSDEWTILTNEIKIIKDELTPLNRINEEKIVGYLDVRKKKAPRIKDKRSLKNKKRIDFVTNREVKCKHSYIINGVLR